MDEIKGVTWELGMVGIALVNLDIGQAGLLDKGPSGRELLRVEVDARDPAVSADPAVIFDTPIEERYEKALSLLGLQSWMLSPGAGHA